jgi:drug/metabolite transporter (DMT)-like permease
MILLAVLFGILSMIGYSLANVSSQPLAKKLGTTQILFLRGLTVALVLAIASVPSFHYFHNVHYVIFSLALGLVGYIPLLAFTHGLKVSRVGIVSPIAGSSPLVTVVLAFIIIGTQIRAIQWIAIVLVVLANIGVSVNLKSLRESNIIKLASGVPFALVATIGWGLFYFALIYPTRAIGPWMAAFLTELGVTIAAGLHLLLIKEKPKFIKSLSPGVIGNGLCIVLGTIGFTVGISRYNVGIVASLSNSMALLSALLAVYFFKEKLNRSEMLAALVMVIGVVLISIT